HIDDEDKGVAKCDTLGGSQNQTIINESGLYSLILSSKLPTAKRFKRWVTSEVLPAIRKHGAYATAPTIDKILDDPDYGIRLLQNLKEEREKRKALEAQNAVMIPKAVFADAVTTSDSCILIGDLAKLLRQNGVEIGQKRLFEYLRSNGFLIKRRGADWNSPTQRAMEMGLFEIKETAITHSDGHVTISKTTKVTGKGQVYFVNRFLGG
ncbi:phage antirepressor, partial [Dubosiella newyorkensis]